jgi:hypothetical protein
MKKIVATIYWMFKSNNHSIPYHRTLMLIVLSFMLHCFQILFLINILTGYLFFQKSNELRAIQWIWGSISLILIMVVLSTMYKKKDLDKIEVSEKTLKKAKLLIPFYLTASTLLLMGLSFSLMKLRH